MPHNILYKCTIGTGGFVATVKLSNINDILGLLVGLATLIYMSASAIKVIRSLLKGD